MNAFSEVINDYISKLKSNLKDQLEMIFIIGSSASDKVIDNWSDIDCILVLKELNKRNLKVITELSNGYKIKIGNTLYSKKEFEDGLVDGKTYYYLFLNQKSIVGIQYEAENLTHPFVNSEILKNITKTILLNDIHDCKRHLIYKELNNDQIKKLFKKIYVIMKSILIINDEFPKNYDETFDLFYKKYNYEYFNYLKFINDYQKNNVDISYLKNYALNLINFIIDKGIIE